MSISWRMFTACKADECEDCIGERTEGADTMRCSCDCHADPYQYLEDDDYNAREEAACQS